MQESRLQVSGLFRVQGSGFRVWGLGFRIYTMGRANSRFQVVQFAA